MSDGKRMMRNARSVVGTHIAKRLRARIPKRTDDEELTDDEILMLEALHCIDSLRWRDPAQVEAEKIIRNAAALIERDGIKPGGKPQANGGHARAAKLSPEARTDIARKAANVRWGNA